DEKFLNNISSSQSLNVVVMLLADSNTTATLHVDSIVHSRVKMEQVGRGAFSVVYKTSYEKYEEVAIKIIKDSHKNQKHFLNELKAYHEFDKYKGISMDKNTGDFILVLNYASFG
ncbi:21181_t:CDS:2, partial [Cetraspora pellucida]